MPKNKNGGSKKPVKKVVNLVKVVGDVHVPSDKLLSDYEVAQLVEKTRLHNERLEENRVVYPDPDALINLDLPTLKRHGFEGFDASADLDSLFKRARGGNKGKGRGKGGGGGGRQLPNPKVVLAVVQQMLGNTAAADNTGPIMFGELNFEFGDRSKAVFFRDSYQEIVSRHHIVFCSEVGPDFITQVASDNPGYTGYCSVANTRNQAVGFLVHSRLKVIGQPISYDDVANVQGVPDLRPAYRLDLEDTVTGAKFAVVVVHLKSMRGGPAVSGKVRYQQCAILAGKLGQNFVGVIAGDWNMILDQAANGKINDLDPLLKAGFVLLNAKDTTATHSGGSRLDGYVVLNFGGLGKLTVHQFFSDPTIGRGLTDHALLTAQK
jgi:hypothetical protein